MVGTVQTAVLIGASRRRGVARATGQLRAMLEKGQDDMKHLKKISKTAPATAAIWNWPAELLKGPGGLGEGSAKQAWIDTF